MTMDDRYEKLLCGLVREYIRTAEPQSSSSLQATLRWPLSSATIRNMLRTLEEEGYIYQPHTSAGRVPTDKGYRHYVNCLVVRDLQAKQIERLAADYKQLSQVHNPSRAAAKLLAQLARAVAISSELATHNLHDAGLSMLLNEPEGNDTAAMREVSTLLDTIDEYLETFSNHGSDNAVAYIGQENPALSAKHTSLVVRTVTIPNEGKIMLMVIGPKRMPYQRHMALLNSFSKVINQTI